jgi:hypothetical protein
VSAYRFSDYELRPIEERDRAQLEAWIAADPFHRDYVQPEFFMNGGMVLEDAEGATYFVRLEPALRVHIQFPPAATRYERERTMKALADGMAWLRSFCRGRGIEQLIFSSKFPPLIRFCVKRLGFKQSTTELLSGIAAPMGTEATATSADATTQEVLTAEKNIAAAPVAHLTSEEKEGSHVRSN